MEKKRVDISLRSAANSRRHSFRLPETVPRGFVFEFIPREHGAAGLLRALLFTDSGLSASQPYIRCRIDEVGLVFNCQMLGTPTGRP